MLVRVGGALPARCQPATRAEIGSERSGSATCLNGPRQGPGWRYRPISARRRGAQNPRHRRANVALQRCLAVSRSRFDGLVTSAMHGRTLRGIHADHGFCAIGPPKKGGRRQTIEGHVEGLWELQGMRSKECFDYKVSTSFASPLALAVGLQQRRGRSKETPPRRRHCASNSGGGKTTAISTLVRFFSPGACLIRDAAAGELRALTGLARARTRAESIPAEAPATIEVVAPHVILCRHLCPKCDCSVRPVGSPGSPPVLKQQNPRRR